MYIRIVEKKVFNFSIVDKNILLIDKKKYFHKNNGTMTKKNTCVICDLKWRIVCTVITHMYVQSWIGLKWKMFYQFETSYKYLAFIDNETVIMIINIWLWRQVFLWISSKYTRSFFLILNLSIWCYINMRCMVSIISYQKCFAKETRGKICRKQERFVFL